MTRIVLAAAHLDSNPTNNRLTNIRALCQRCRLLHDRSHHLALRRITYRRRLAVGDLFLGPYQALIALCHGLPPHPRLQTDDPRWIEFDHGGLHLFDGVTHQALRAD